MENQLGGIRLESQNKSIINNSSGNSYQARPNKDIISVASPKKLKNPTISVTVVNIIDEDWAGSWPTDLSRIGITAPENPAIAIEKIMEIPITIANPSEEAQIYTINDVVKATAIPFTVPTINSFLATLIH